MIVTRYVRGSGQIVRHIYAGESGDGWPTFSRARTAWKNHLKETIEQYGEKFVEEELASGKFEIDIVKVINL